MARAARTVGRQTIDHAADVGAGGEQFLEIGVRRQSYSTRVLDGLMRTRRPFRYFWPVGRLNRPLTNIR
ncbi:MAG: hypothetical protein JWQ55_6579 [Rhodopila sp.]|jgi:hypothetical protein|nr:hypothetical protein [Rhodopila sp.]